MSSIAAVSTYETATPIWIVVLICAVALIIIPSRLVARSGGGTRAAVVVGLFLVVSTSAAAFAASRGAYYSDDENALPWIGVPLAVLLTAILIGIRAPSLQRALQHPATLTRLVVPQVCRLVGTLFVVQLISGDLPALFGLIAGLGDIAVGVSAIILLLLARRRPLRLTTLYWFNLLGLLDLAVAVSIGVAGWPGVLHILPLVPTTQRMTVLPLTLIPAAFIPIVAAAHILSLRRISAARLSGATMSPITLVPNQTSPALSR